MMRARILFLAAAVVLAALTAGCGTGPSQNPKDPAPQERATLNEALAGMNTLMSDAVSISAGLASNAVISDFATGMPCLLCDFELELQPHLMPGLFLLFYEYDADWEPTAWRLATGTFSYDSARSRFAYDPAEPADSLVIAWPDARTGDAMEVRFDWQDISRATTYDQMVYNSPIPFVPNLASYPYPSAQELEVPGKVTVNVRKGSEEILHLDVEQTWAETACGRLVEYRHVSASGFFRSGAQAVELTRFEFDHTQDDTIALSLEAEVRSGSLRLPVVADMDFSAEKVTRRSDNCQLGDMVGPFDGSFDVRAGGATSGIGLSFGWDVAFENDDLAEPYTFSPETARLDVGQKYVDITGFIDTESEYGGLSVDNVFMTFADVTNLPITDFVLDLTLPELPF